MSVPAWKQAILDRKKKAEEEQRKKEEEEASFIASLPPWKRALVKKQRSPGSTLEKKETGKPTSTNASDPSNKWMAAVQHEKAKESPKLPHRQTWAKQSPSPVSSTKETPSSYSGRSSKPATRPTTNSFSGALSAFSSNKTTSPTSTVKPTSNFRPAATTKVTAASSPATRRSVTTPNSSDTLSTSPPSLKEVSLRHNENTHATVISDKRRSFEGDDDEDAKLAAMPAWKKAIILRRRAAASQPSKEPRPQPLRERSATAPQNSLRSTRHTATVSKKEPESTKITITRNTPEVDTYEPPVETELNVTEGTDEVDLPHEPTIEAPKRDEHVERTPVQPSVVRNAKPARASKGNEAPRKSKEAKPKTASQPTSASKSPSAKPIATKKAPSRPSANSKRQPEVVNRPKPDSDVPTKLVEQEGVVHRPPAYKVVDEWANVSENDPQFKKLPLWKQALIKRRRSDYAKRSAAPKAPSSAKQQNSSTSSYGSKKQTDNDTSSWKTEPKKTNTSHGSNKQLGSNIQPIRKAPARPAPTPTPPTPPPPEEEEPMFSFSFSKKGKHRTLDAGSESEDSDSDLEDVTLTNIDDLSDEDSGIDKGGIVVMGYKVTNTEYASEPESKSVVTPTTQTTRGMKKSDSKSILSDPVKRVKVCMHVLVFIHHESIF